MILFLVVFVSCFNVNFFGWNLFNGFEPCRRLKLFLAKPQDFLKIIFEINYK